MSIRLLIEQQARHCFEKGFVLLLGLYQKEPHVSTGWCWHGVLFVLGVFF